MKMMLLAAAAALTLGSASAFASDGGDWYPPNTAAQFQQVQQAAPQHSQATGNTAIYAVQAHAQRVRVFGGGNG